MNRQYQEYSTGANFRDSEAFVLEEVSNPGIIAFHKVWRDHISKTLLEPYHAAHHFLASKEIPSLDISWTFDGYLYDEFVRWNYDHIQLSVLDLDPTDIWSACAIDTRKEYIVTNPLYIDGACMFTYLQPVETRLAVIQHIKNFCAQYWIYIESRDSQNFLITKLENWVLYITCTDIASDVRQFHEDVEGRIGDYDINKHQEVS